MKSKNFKITGTTLFVYRSKNLKTRGETNAPTDPTTTMVTITRTGSTHPGSLN